MSYPYDREFFDYQLAPVAAPLGYDFYSLPQPAEHLPAEALGHICLPLEEDIKPQGFAPFYRSYNGWRTAAAVATTEWRPVTQWPQVEAPYVDVAIKPRPIPTVESSASKPFRCQICGKAFSQAANLTAHNRVHTGEKPFECPVCNRPFSQSSSLVTHRRTHTGERPYPCKHCDKAFTDSSTLTKHLRTHTGQKPYGCPLCSMRFTQSGNLHRHMKTHKH